MKVGPFPRHAFQALILATLPPAYVENLVNLLDEFDTCFTSKESKLECESWPSTAKYWGSRGNASVSLQECLERESYCAKTRKRNVGKRRDLGIE